MPLLARGPADPMSGATVDGPAWGLDIPATIAALAGVALSDDAVTERLRAIDGMPAEMRASMAIDLSQGRRLELPWLSGAVVRLGKELGVPVPANDFVCRALKLHQMGEV